MGLGYDQVLWDTIRISSRHCDFVAKLRWDAVAMAQVHVRVCMFVYVTEGADWPDLDQHKTH